MVCIVKHLLWLHGVHCETFVVASWCVHCACTCGHICLCVCVCVCGTYVHLHVRNYAYGIVSVKRDLMHGFSRFQIFGYYKSLKCPLHIASYALRIGVSVMESEGSEFLINASITFLLRVLEIL